jgi:hypothetical protein
VTGIGIVGPDDWDCVTVTTTTEGPPNAVNFAVALPVLESSATHCAETLAINVASVAFTVAQHALHPDAYCNNVGQKHASSVHALIALPIGSHAAVHCESSKYVLCATVDVVVATPKMATQSATLRSWISVAIVPLYVFSQAMQSESWLELPFCTAIQMQ